MDTLNGTMIFLVHGSNGKIYGTKTYFNDMKLKQTETTIDAINAFFNSRDVINKADFIPCNKIGGVTIEIIENPATCERVLNTFKGQSRYQIN